MTDTVKTALIRALTEAHVPVTAGEPLSRHTTFRIGGPAALCASPASSEGLIAALDAYRAVGGGCPLCLLGRGSNVLASDDGFDGLVILTGGADDTAFGEDGIVRAGCGASLTALAAACVKDGRALSGLEFAYGIPGSVGGAVLMNAGAYGGEMSQIVVQSTYYDLGTGETVTVSGDAHDFAYRHSCYSDHPDRVLLSAVLRLLPGSADVIRARMERNMNARRDKQPLQYPSAGSVFKRPAEPGVYVGAMVEGCGLKGYTIGGAQVSEKHAGFIINRGGATAADVLALVGHVRQVVYDTFGYRLECEIRRIGS